MKVYEELKDETRYLKEQMVDLSNSTSYTTSLDENEDLETRMHKIKVKFSKCISDLMYHIFSDG